MTFVIDIKGGERLVVISFFFSIGGTDIVINDKGGEYFKLKLLWYVVIDVIMCCKWFESKRFDIVLCFGSDIKYEVLMR